MLDSIKWRTGHITFDKEGESREIALKAGEKSRSDKLPANMKRRVNLLASTAADVYLSCYGGHGTPISLSEKLKNSFKLQIADIVGESMYGKKHELASKITRLNNTLASYEGRINAGNVLIETSNGGYPHFLFLSDGVDPTCEQCEQNHGRVLSAEEAIELEAIPPLHPNCHCILAAIDNRTLDLYNKYNGFSSDVKRFFINLGGGIFRLNLSDDGTGISAVPIEIKDSISNEISGIVDKIFNAIVEFVDSLFGMKVSAEEFEHELDDSIQSMIDQNMPQYDKSDDFFGKLKKLFEGFVWGNVQRNYDEQMGEEYDPYKNDNPYEIAGDRYGATFDPVVDYIRRSVDQLIRGNYSDEVTLLGTAAQVGTGIAGIDLPTDIRDVFYDITNWKWTWGHAGQTLIDSIGLFPVIGIIKNADEVNALIKGAAKHSDEFAGVAKHGDEVLEGAGSKNLPKYPGNDPVKPPSGGYEWRGKGVPGSKEGNWYNPNTKEWLRPDLNHLEPIKPHWDYGAPDGKTYRIFPDGTFELK